MSHQGHERWSGSQASLASALPLSLVLTGHTGMRCHSSQHVGLPVTTRWKESWPTKPPPGLQRRAATWSMTVFDGLQCLEQASIWGQRWAGDCVGHCNGDPGACAGGPTGHCPVGQQGQGWRSARPGLGVCTPGAPWHCSRQRHVPCLGRPRHGPSIQLSGGPAISMPNLL